MGVEPTIFEQLRPMTIKTSASTETATTAYIACDIRLPRSDRNSVASMLLDPVSIAIGTKWCAAEAGIFVYLVRRRWCTAVLRRCSWHQLIAPAHSAVSTIWKAAYVSVTVTSQASGLPRTHGISVAPSGRFSSVRDRPICFLFTWIWVFFTASQMRSFNCECRMCL